jgi:DNA-binding MarR family transcriptional regulator
LKELLDKGFVEQRAGLSDRRQRLLFATEQGRALAVELAGLQTQRIARALREAGTDAGDGVASSSRRLIEPAERTGVERLTGSVRPFGRTR